MENPTKMDDLGVPLFSEASIFKTHFRSSQRFFPNRFFVLHIEVGQLDGVVTDDRGEEFRWWQKMGGFHKVMLINMVNLM